MLGFLHAMLLYIGDILAAYGVLLFVGVWALRWKDKTLLVVAALVMVVNLLPSDASLPISSAPPDGSMLPLDPLSGFAERITVQPIIAFLGPLGFVVPFLVGVWDQDILNLFGMVHHATGLFGGMGYAALVALIAVRLGARRGPISLAVSAVGQRSLTCYLAQSVIWTLVFAPYPDAPG